MINTRVLFLLLLSVFAIAMAKCPSKDKIYARGISEKGKQEMINIHNHYRKEIANGRVCGQPRGVNLKRMKYDAILGKSARLVSDQCAMKHVIIKDDRYSWVGQNLFISRSSIKTPDQNWTKAVTSWFDEHIYFIYPNSEKDNGVVGHYTQVVSADSFLVGCDFIHYYDERRPRYPYTKLYTCNYGPGGHRRESGPYKTGKSGCENLC